MIAASQCKSALDASLIDAGVASGMKNGECAAAGDNLNAIVSIFSPYLWSYLFQKFKTNAFLLGAALSMGTSAFFRLAEAAKERESLADLDSQE